MVCTYCRSSTKVVNSRHQRRANATWRRRACESCAAIFTTIETTDLSTSVRFSDIHHALIPFSRDVLFISLYESCRHRPEAIRDAGNLVELVVAKLLAAGSPGLVPRARVIQTCIQALAPFDSTAAAVYAAYHPL